MVLPARNARYFLMPESPLSPSAAADRRLKHPEEWARAQVIPFAVFMGILLLSPVVGSLILWEHPAAPWWRHWPEQWVYPLQTVITLGVLAKYWRWFEFRWSWKWTAAAVVFGAVGIGFWLLPTTLYDRMGLTGESQGWMKWLGIEARKKGFNPAEAFGEGTAAYWLALVMRFIRAAVVVALVEEIFWRSFLMRYVEDWNGNYWTRPFGKGGWKSYLAVTLAFMLAHNPVDYAGAVVYGSLTYLLCVWSRSLGACVVMHAVANLLMGLYAIHYGKFGLW